MYMHVHLNSKLQSLFCRCYTTSGVMGDHLKWSSWILPPPALDQSDDKNCMRRVSLDWKEALKTTVPRFWEDLNQTRHKDSFEGMLLQSSGLQSHTALRLLQLYPKINCQRASRAKTVGLRGGQLNATRSIAADRKILDRAVKSVRCRFPGDFSGVRFHM